MSLLKKIGEIGGALTLSTAMMIGAENKAEAHHPHYYPGPVSHTVIGPFGGVCTRTYIPPTYLQPAPIIIQAPVFIPRIIVQPAPVYVNPAPVYVQPAPIICW
ncbi:PXPV repeat (3 copies) [uncultured archaeon]|nr:PXPV repeat (3 copies) [uncultured archaeon]